MGVVIKIKIVSFRPSLALLFVVGRPQSATTAAATPPTTPSQLAAGRALELIYLTPLIIINQ